MIYRGALEMWPMLSKSTKIRELRSFAEVRLKSLYDGSLGGPFDSSRFRISYASVSL